ncbi:DUF2271 domain-containing protein [uncultured Treponema sp.]|uniref:DUF2271 domain-containing protein n=1 Tax=uncultured Treponema sp. TaxID=162155 RepID=UPI00259262B5|nr:DUF2271 domain-containing protein [uncultured Treponema sp.]
MKKFTIKFTVLFLLLAACSPAFCEKVKVYIEPGEVWNKRAPQIAVWVYNEQSGYEKTLYVTKSASEKGWKFSPKNGRPDSLPVWYAASRTDPSKTDRTRFDAVSGATPKKGLTAECDFELKAGRTYIFYAEVNQSFDYNESFTKKNSGVNGQPSCVYSGTLTVPQKKDKVSEIKLQLCGTGSLDGTDGDINKSDLPKLTTAGKIVKNIYISFEK